MSRQPQEHKRMCVWYYSIKQRDDSTSSMKLSDLFDTAEGAELGSFMIYPRPPPSYYRARGRASHQQSFTTNQTPRVSWSGRLLYPNVCYTGIDRLESAVLAGLDTTYLTQQTGTILVVGVVSLDQRT